MLQAKWSCFRRQQRRKGGEGDVYAPSNQSESSSCDSQHDANSLALSTSSSVSLHDDRLSKRSTLSLDCLELARCSPISTFNNPTFGPQRSLRPPRRRFSVALIGDHEVGKTCLAFRLTRNTFISRYNRSSKQLFRTVQEIEGEACELRILDMGADIGATNHVMLLEPRIAAVVFIYSATSPQSFVNVQFLRDAVLGEDCNIPVMLLANKKDETKSVDRVSASNGQFLARRFRAAFAEVSAKTGEGVHDAFRDLMTRMTRHYDMSLRRHDTERTPRAFSYHPIPA